MASEVAFAKIVSGFPRVPIVTASFNRAPIKNEFKDFLASLARFYEYKRPFTMLMVPKNMGMGILKQVSHLVRYMRDYENEHRLYLTKTAIVSNSGAVRMFIQAAFKIKKPVSDIQTFATLSEAHTWLGWEERMKKARDRKTNKT